MTNQHYRLLMFEVGFACLAFASLLTVAVSYSHLDLLAFLLFVMARTSIDLSRMVPSMGKEVVQQQLS